MRCNYLSRDVRRAFRRFIRFDSSVQSRGEHANLASDRSLQAGGAICLVE
jgi:hypothetical protein